jgi:hypothetical protein
VVDSARQGAVLAATANSQTTFYLYGLGVFAEQTTSWAYYLKDSQNTVRQMTNATAKEGQVEGALLAALLVVMGEGVGLTAYARGSIPQAYE